MASDDYEIISHDYARVHDLAIKDYKRDGYLKNIHFLPVANSFIRNIIRYEVEQTFVKTIGKKSFDGMIWLEMLYLRSNLIETVQKDAVQGLNRLQFLSLSK